MLKVVMPNSKDKIKQQIAALEYIIKQDTISNNMKDLQIHSQVLKDLQEQLLYISYMAMQSEEFIGLLVVKLSGINSINANQKYI